MHRSKWETYGVPIVALVIGVLIVVFLIALANICDAGEWQIAPQGNASFRNQFPAAPAMAKRNQECPGGQCSVAASPIVPKAASIRMDITPPEYLVAYRQSMADGKPLVLIVTSERCDLCKDLHAAWDTKRPNKCHWVWIDLDRHRTWLETKRLIKTGDQLPKAIAMNPQPGWQPGDDTHWKCQSYYREDIRQLIWHRHKDGLYQVVLHEPLPEAPVPPAPAE
jgi:hypothetical protein